MADERRNDRTVKLAASDITSDAVPSIFMAILDKCPSGPVLLDLSGNRIGNQSLGGGTVCANTNSCGVVDIAKAMRMPQMKGIQALDLSNNNITKGIQVLLDAIKELDAIKTVNLLENNISYEECCLLIEMREEHPTLQSLCGNSGDETYLDLGGKDFAVGDATMLAAEIVDNHSLTQLTFSGAVPSNQAMFAERYSVTMEASMTDADISHKALGPSGSILLASFLGKCKLMTSLNLASNRIVYTGAMQWRHSISICHSGMEALVNAVVEMSDLTELDLSGNNFISKESHTLLCIMLHGNPVLKRLDLSDCNIEFPLASMDLPHSYHRTFGINGFATLAHAIQNNEVISAINLTKNRIPAQQSCKLGELMHMHTSLRTLCGLHGGDSLIEFHGTHVLSGHPDPDVRLDPGDCMLLMHDIIENKDAQSLDLSGTHLGPSGIIILHAVHGHQAVVGRLTSLDLQETAICAEGLRLISRVLGSHSSMTALDLADNYITTRWAWFDRSMQDLDMDRPNGSPLSERVHPPHVVGLGVESLANVLPTMAVLSTLNLEKNDLGLLLVPDGWRHAVDIVGIQWTHIDGRTMCAHPGKQTGIDVIADAIQDMTALTSLNLGYNGIGHRVVAIAAAVNNGRAPLCMLCLRDNDLGTVSAGKALGEMLKHNSLLQTLDLSANAVAKWHGGDAAGFAEELAKGIGANYTLTSLELSSNSIGNLHAGGCGRVSRYTGITPPPTPAEAINILTTAIGEAEHLVSVNLLENGIGVEQARALKAILEEHPSLKSLCGNNGDETELDMSGEIIGVFGAAGAVMIAQEIADNPALTAVNLLSLDIPAEHAQEIVRIARSKENPITLCGGAGVGLTTSLSCCTLTPGDAVFIAHDLVVRKIDVLDVSIPEFGNSCSGADAMSHVTATCTSQLECMGYLAGAMSRVTDLNIAGNGLTAEMMAVLAGGIGSTVQKLDISSNCLCNMHWNIGLNVMTTLDISGNMIDPTGGQRLAMFLKDNEVLKDLDFSDNNLTNGGTDKSGLDAIALAIPTMCALDTLTFGDHAKYGASTPSTGGLRVWRSRDMRELSLPLSTAHDQSRFSKVRSVADVRQHSVHQLTTRMTEVKLRGGLSFYEIKVVCAFLRRCDRVESVDLSHNALGLIPLAPIDDLDDLDLDFEQPWVTDRECINDVIGTIMSMSTVKCVDLSSNAIGLHHTPKRGGAFDLIKSMDLHSLNLSNQMDANFNPRGMCFLTSSFTTWGNMGAGAMMKMNLLFVGISADQAKIAVRKLNDSHHLRSLCGNTGYEDSLDMHAKLQGDGDAVMFAAEVEANPCLAVLSLDHIHGLTEVGVTALAGAIRCHRTLKLFRHEMVAMSCGIGWLDLRANPSAARTTQGTHKQVFAFVAAFIPKCPELTTVNFQDHNKISIADAKMLVALLESLAEKDHALKSLCGNSGNEAVLDLTNKVSDIGCAYMFAAEVRANPLIESLKLGTHSYYHDSITVSLDTSMTEVLLASAKIDYPMSIVIVAFVPKCVCLTSINLADNSLGDKGAEQIFSLIGDGPLQLHELTALDISKNGICARGARKLAKSLKRCNGITFLDISDNAMNTKYIRNKVRINGTLEDEVDTTGIDALLDIIRTLKLRSVNMRKIGLDRERVGRLADIFDEHPTLRSLCGNVGNETAVVMSLGGEMDCSGNDLFLLKAEFSKFIYTGRLKSLNIRGARLCTKRGGKVMTGILAENTGLTELDFACNNWNLHGNWLGDEVGFARAIAIGLRQANLKRITFSDGTHQGPPITLDVSHSACCPRNLDLAGTIILAAFLPSCTRVSTLDLRANLLGNGDEPPEWLALDRASFVAAQCLPTCLSLTDLDLSNNHLGVSGAEDVAQFLAACKMLLKLDISCNEMCAEGGRAIALALEGCIGLEILNIADNQLGFVLSSAPEPVPDCLHLARTIRNHLEKLRELTISGDGDRGSVTLKVGMSEADLSGLHIGVTGMPIAAFLARCSRLTALNLMNNHIGVVRPYTDTLGLYTDTDFLGDIPNGIKLATPSRQPVLLLVMDAIAQMSQLTRLNLAGNDLGMCGAKTMVSCLCAETKINVLTVPGLAECKQPVPISLVGVTARHEGITESRLCPPLRCLILANNDLFHYDTSALVALAGAFRTMPDLTSLWLSYNGSGNTDTATHYQHGVEVGNLILACARDIPTLCHMRCTENNIPEPLQSAIDLQVRENRLQEFHRRESGTPVVTDLDLSSRHIESDDANMLKSWIVCMTPNVIEPRYHHDGLPTRDTVTALNLSDNAFDWQGVVHIAACITSMSALTDLNLSDNDSGGAHPMGYCAAELGVALATTPSNLTVLRLAFMNMLARDAIHIARGIQEQKRLKVLDVSGNPLYAEGGTTIATSLKALKLEELYFASCNIGRPMLFVDAAPPNRPPSCASDLEALRVLDDAIKCSNTIVTLDISGNTIRADGFQLLAPSLHSRNSITHLNLSNNYISQFDDGSRYVELRESYANIARMQSLIHLDFTDNEIHRDADPADYQADIAMRDDIRWCRENTNIAVNFMAHQFKRNALYGNTYCTTINGHSEVTEHLRAFLIATAYTYGSARRYACAIQAKRVTVPEELGAGPSKRSVTRSLSLLFAELSCGKGFEVKVATLVGRFL